MNSHDERMAMADTGAAAIRLGADAARSVLAATETLRGHVQIKTVLGPQSRTPGILAFVDNVKVRWSPRRAWECDCLFPDDPDCGHIDAVRAVVHPSTWAEER